MCDRKSFTADFDFLLHAGVSADPSNSQSGARGIRRGDLVGVEGYVGRNQRGEVPSRFVLLYGMHCVHAMLAPPIVWSAGMLLRDGPHHPRPLCAPVAQGDPDRVKKVTRRRENLERR
jgi:hypothetical protein